MTVHKIGSTQIEETKRNGIVRYAFDDTRIYRIRVESMPGFFTNVYLILDTEATLVDPGSHEEKSRSDLLKGFKTLNKSFDEDVQLSDVGSIIVTHGHGDHFLMLMHEELRDRKVYVHPSDGRMIQDYAIGYPDWMKYITAFAEEAGSSFTMDEFSMWSPASLPSTSWEGYELVDVIDGDEILNGYRVYHTPGHAPGHICVKVGPVLFVGDHILSITTPHQTPESYRQGLGLATYLASLRKVADMEVMLGLAGHESPIYPVGDRALEIEAFHHQRLKELVDLCQKDMNLYQLTDKYYRNHPELLGAPTLANLDEVSAVTAMEEIKAHVEYLINNDRMSVTDNANGILLYRSN